MTDIDWDASFVARIGTARVIDLRPSRHGAYAAFQRAMRPEPKTARERWWTAQRIAIACFVTCAIGPAVVGWSIIALRMIGAW